MANGSPDAWFTASWGSIRLWCSSVQTDNSRTKVVHELSRGDTHPVQDQGLRARRTRCMLLFQDFPGERDTPSNMFRRLKAAVDSGASAIFTHPVDGSYLAEVGEFTYDLDEHSNVENCTIEFIAAEEIEPISPTAAGVIGAAGEASVASAADNLDEALAAVGISTDVTADAKAKTEVWTQGLSAGESAFESVPVRQVLADAADLSARLVELINTGGASAIPFEDDLSLFDAYRATVMLGDAIRSAAIAATSDSPTTFVMRVTTSTALLSLMAKIYGGAVAEDYARQVADLNDIKTPGWLPVGDYVMPTRSSAQRASF